MKRIKSIVGVICAVLCLVMAFTVSVFAVDTETTTAEPTETVTTTAEPTETVTTATVTGEEFIPPDKGTLEGVCFTFLTFFFSAATVHTYGDFFAKLTIIFVIFIVAWLFKCVFGIFKKRR